ncbi:VanZ family protein [Streptomyces sp. KHY 26]|uniref:VanZ family protein n=1 Tax=Streptomyces sp. KHY 26 TaxID=3097359 RepID=UPI00376EAAC2
MFTAIFQHHYGYLTICTLIALALGAGAWWLARRTSHPEPWWWALCAATLTGVLGVTFMGGGKASRTCVINHNLAEPFHTTQGAWNLAMMVPLGLFAVLASRQPLPTLTAMVLIPPAIEFTQATVDGLGRVCDTSDAEMNIIGGLIGLVIGAGVLAVRHGLAWKAGAKGSMVAAVAALVLGSGVVQPMLSFTNVDGTGLSAADSPQREAVQRAVTEAFGNRYKLGDVYEQPCGGQSCTNIIFNLLSREEGQSQAFASGSLSWPDEKHLNVLLEDSDRPNVMGYPVPETKAPASQQDAVKISQAYAARHYPWAKNATMRHTSRMGEKAELGWMTNWRWTDANKVLMPRMLDVQVDRAGRVSQVDVTWGPTHVKLSAAHVNGKQAEAAVRKALSRRHDGSTVTLPAGMTIKAFALKAEQRDGAWHPEWLVSVIPPKTDDGSDTSSEPQGETWRVDAATGRVYDDGGVLRN